MDAQNLLGAGTVMICAKLLHLLLYKNILLLLGASDYRSEKLLTFTIYFYSMSKSRRTSQTTLKSFFEIQVLPLPVFFFITLIRFCAFLR